MGNKSMDWTPIILLGAIAGGGYLLYKSGIFQGLKAVGGGLNTIIGLPGQVQQGIGDWYKTSTTDGFLMRAIREAQQPKEDRFKLTGPVPKRIPIPEKYRFEGKNWEQRKTIMSRAKIERERYPFRSHYGQPRLLTTKQGTSIVRYSGR